MTTLSDKRPATTTPGPAPRVDTAALEQVLLGRWADIRRSEIGRASCRERV